MARQNELIKVTILSGTSSVEIVPPVAVGQSRVSLKVGLGMCTLMAIYAPAILAETCSVQVSPDETGNYFVVTGVVPTAGNVVSFVPPPAMQMRLFLATPAAQDHPFWCVLQYDMST
jgi:hypothetical protein